MIQNRFHVSATDAWEPFDELIDCRTITQVLKQSSDWNASAAKYPRSTNFVAVSLYGVQIFPFPVQFIAPWNSRHCISPELVISDFGEFVSRSGNGVYQPTSNMSPGFALHRMRREFRTETSEIKPRECRAFAGDAVGLQKSEPDHSRRFPDSQGGRSHPCTGSVRCCSCAKVIRSRTGKPIAQA